jgi:3-oxoacyl-[acyl-carrier protein] reductase
VPSAKSDVLGLSGKTAIVTGAGRGIGKATAELFTTLGLNLVVVDQKFESRAHNTTGNFIRHRGDVADPKTAHTVVKSCIEEFGSVDILVNNAALNLGGALLDCKDQQWDRMMDVNLKGYRNFARETAKLMIKKKNYGRIINVSSVDDIMAEPGGLSYSASKGAIIAFTKCLAIELAPFGIRVNSIVPGWCDTPGGTGKLNAKLRRRVIKRIPLRYIAPPIEIAGAIAFLASNLAKYLTGSVLVADGGLTSDISILGLTC